MKIDRDEDWSGGKWNGTSANGGVGKQWKETKTPFRPKAGKSKSWDVKVAERTKMAAMKAKEKEMKDEKEAERQVRLFQPPPLRFFEGG